MIVCMCVRMTWLTVRNMEELPAQSTPHGPLSTVPNSAASVVGALSWMCVCGGVWVGGG